MDIVDFELEAQLKRYAAQKEQKKAIDKESFADFSETDDDSVTIKQTYSDELEIEEDDDE